MVASSADDILDEFYVEPWRVQRRLATLTLTEGTTTRERWVSAMVVLGIALGVAGFDVWLFWKTNVGVFVGLLIAFAAVLLLGKALELFRRARRGARVLTFDQQSASLVLSTGKRQALSDLLEVVIVRYGIHEPDKLDPDRHRREYGLDLQVGGERLPLGTYSARASAERLGQVIADFVHIPVRDEAGRADDLLKRKELWL